MNRPIARALPVALLVLATAAPVLAEGGRGATFELFGTHVRSTADSRYHQEAFGLRGGYRFGSTWAVEGEVSQLYKDVWFGDLSAKAYLIDTSRFEIYALAGPGLYKVRGQGSGEATVHVGIGAEVGLTSRLYLRPEVRGRWLAEELKANDGIVQYSLGLGWRF